MLILLITRSDLPLFWIVTVLFDVLPGFTSPKLTDLGLTDILGGPGGFVSACVPVNTCPAMALWFVISSPTAHPSPGEVK
jgi:hypothetical protein